MLSVEACALNKPFSICPLALPVNRVVMLTTLYRLSKDNCPPGLLSPGMLQEANAAVTPSSAAGDGSAGVVFSTPTQRGHLLYTSV